MRVEENTILLAGVPWEDPCELPRAVALPQLLRFFPRPDGSVDFEQSVHIRLGGWLPMGVVYGMLPDQMLMSAARWREWTLARCVI